MDQAINECIEEGILAQFLIGHKAEVKDMLITEYNEEKTMQAFAKEYYEDGEKRGILNIAKNMLDKDMDIETICDITGLSQEELKEISK